MRVAHWGVIGSGENLCLRMSGVRRRESCLGYSCYGRESGREGNYKGNARNVMKGKEWRKEEEKEDEGEEVEDK